MKRNLIFLDIDGVLNCEIFYKSRTLEDRAGLSYEHDNLCVNRIMWISRLCADTCSDVVISSTWRHGKNVEELQAMFVSLNGKFKVVGVTPNLQFHKVSKGHAEEWDSSPSTPRGSEIKYFLEHTSIDWSNYAIIDDDADMLLSQAAHFFQTDPYAGLTPFTCGRVASFLKLTR